MFKEFKNFAMRGNVVDLAVGVVIGAAFTAIINSLVKDVPHPAARLGPPAASISRISFSS